MNRVTLQPRENWQHKLEEAGCYYHTIDGKPYWNERAAYEFTAPEIDAIELAANALHAMCLEHCDWVVHQGDYQGYGFPDEVKRLIERSWHYRDPYILGRFDLGYNGRDIKLYEYNADTPTALPEASVWQWQALEDRGWHDQFNSIHERLLQRFAELFSGVDVMHFAAMASDEHEDWANLHYLMETALESGAIHKGVSLDIEALDWAEKEKVFTDANGEAVSLLFKLYPWEWLMGDEFGWQVRGSKTQFIEPAWKMLLSTKALLPLLWKRYPRHSNLLEAYFEKESDWVAGPKPYIRKPLLGREGANVTIVQKGEMPIFNVGRANGNLPQYDDRGYIVQEYFPSIANGDVNGMTPVLGVWMVGEEACGLGIREDAGITTNASMFVPHFFTE